MGRALLFPYFAMSAQPPRAFPARALAQRHTTAPRGWAARCFSHILLCRSSRRGLFRPGLWRKGTPQHPGDGPRAAFPIFCYVGAAAAGFSGCVDAFWRFACRGRTCLLTNKKGPLTGAFFSQMLRLNACRCCRTRICPGTRPRRPALPRCGSAGCTWRYGPFWT